MQPLEWFRWVDDLLNTVHHEWHPSPGITPDPTQGDTAAAPVDLILIPCTLLSAAINSSCDSVA
ncbi:hypothetical protein T02_2362 [Trichinella nativa]|uniref:Uncharacterized protein n=1 Tax=Trichinella nativa TaxID=6335 RepID=A0A0V1KSS3_9BILA|nr:hypothetical protein T02_2362 [Trichinella nativa]